jgi:hypothetical protein
MWADFSLYVPTTDLSKTTEALYSLPRSMARPGKCKASFMKNNTEQLYLIPTCHQLSASVDRRLQKLPIFKYHLLSVQRVHIRINFITVC